jgi:hypothetical protein
MFFDAVGTRLLGQIDDVQERVIRLKYQRRPEDRYLQNPMAFLPASFLFAAGLIAELPEPDPEPEPTYQPIEPPAYLTLTTPVRQGLTAGEAWERVIQHLQQNRILPVLLDRLLDSEIQFVDQTFRVVVEDPQVRAMLEDRLSSTINRLLPGICSGETFLQFV